jgi:putative redox protein
MPSETKHVALEWSGGLRFTGGEPGGPTTLIDADNVEAPGPMLALLLAAASCSAADVVLILQKMRVELHTLRVAVAGVRRETDPKRYLSMHLTYEVGGTGVDEAKARRAIDLSIEKYCSVIHSLAADLRITYDLRLV